MKTREFPTRIWRRSGWASFANHKDPTQSILETDGNAVLHMFGLAAVFDCTVLLIDLIYILI
jgi:hypothetical protein